MRGVCIAKAVTPFSPSCPLPGDEYAKSLTEKHVPMPDPGLCMDNHEMCGTWVKAGECKNNPGYMVS